MEKLIIPIMALAFSLLVPFYSVKADAGSEEFKINSKYKCSKLKLKENTYISDYKYEDINGDGIKDNIILTGYRRYEPTCPFRENIKVVIRDGKTEKYYAVSPGKIDGGAGARLFAGDFDGDKVKDILVTIDTGGSGGCSWYSIFSFKNNKCKHLINEEKFSKGLDFDISYSDNFKVSILNKSLKKIYILDVENKKDTYTNLDIYSKSGKLIKGTTGNYDSISELVPIDINNDGIYELKAIQSIWGICHVDILGYGKTIWQYSSNRMELQDFQLLEFAAPGSREKLQRVIPVWSH